MYLYNINISTLFRLLVADAWDVQLEFRNFFTKNNIIYNLSEMVLPISTKITLVLFLLVKPHYCCTIFNIMENGLFKEKKPNVRYVCVREEFTKIKIKIEKKR